MLASCGLEVKFHNWESGECYGSVSVPDSRGFFDIDWCCQGVQLAAVPIAKSSFIISSNIGKDNCWKPTKEVIDVENVRCVSYSKLEVYNIALGTSTGEILLYDAQSKSIVEPYAEVQSPVNMLDFGAQDLFLCAGCENGQILLYIKGKGVVASYFVPNSTSLTAMKAHPRTPHILAGGGEKGIVAVWDINSGNRILQAANHDSCVLDMSFSISDNSFSTIGKDQRINIYDLRTSECVHEKQFDSDLTTLAYCPNGTDIAVGTGLGQVVFLDMRYLHSCKGGIKAHYCPIRKLSFDSDNMYLLNAITGNNSICTADGEILDEGTVVLSEDSGLKTPGSHGDCEKDKARFNRYLYKSAEKFKSSEETSRCYMDPVTNSGRTIYHIVDEDNLNQLRKDVVKANKEIVDDLIEMMNNEFLKMRMDVSREFCTMEIGFNKRWHEFYMILLKIADLEDHENSDLDIISAKKSSVNTDGSKFN